MGIYTNLATTTAFIKTSKPRVGLDRSSANQMLNKADVFDPAIGSAYAAGNEVQTIPTQTDSGAADTYTLTINLPRLAVGTFTTAAIAYDAVDTVIETAIDVAATSAAVTGWTNADISVSMGGAAGASDGTVILTFDGTSVANQPVELTVLTATGFTKDGPVVRTTGGQQNRQATQALYELNAIAGTLQQSAEAPTWTKPESNGQTRPRTSLLRDLALQTIVEDGTEDAYDAIVALYPEAGKMQ